MWTPSEPELQTLVSLFEQSVDVTPGHNMQRAEARKQLEAARDQPDLSKYLVYLLTESNYSEKTRATAGLYLKTVLITEWRNLTPDAISYVQASIVHGLSSTSKLIRNASSVVVTTLLSQKTLQGWPELLPEIIAAIDSSAPGEPIQEGCLSALKVICEDSAGLVAQNDELLNALVPKLIDFCRSESPRVRANAVACLTEFVPHGAQGFLVHIDDFMQTLFTLAQHDNNTDTLSCICRAFTEILTVRPDKLMPYLTGVVQFCSHCTKNDATNTSLDGAEFLLSLAESDLEEEIITQLLPLMVPTLLETMVLSADDLFVLESVDEDDSSQADREQDIKPSIPKTKKGHGVQTEEEDEDDDMEYSLEDWNLRKCSAMTLDYLAMKDASSVVECALPILLNRIASNQEWPVRESAVLAFGAIAQGVLQAGITSFVPELVPFLCELLSSEHAPIREITCWTLSRYTGQDGLDWPSFQGVLNCTLDVNKRVQATACAALSTLAENAGSELEPYASELFTHLGNCFNKYQAKNMLALYECVQTCAMALSRPVSETPQILSPCLQPMLQRWSLVTEEDQEMLALLESFSFLAISMGAYFQPYAPPLFEKSVLLIRDCLVLMERASIDPLGCEYPEPMIVVSALDMIDGLVQALQSDGMTPLFQAQENSTQTRISEMIMSCLNQEDYDIRQSALALLGDLAIYCFDTQLVSDMPKLMPYLVELLDVKSIENDIMYEPVGDNTMWALSEIAVHTEYSLDTWFAPLFEKLGTILLSKENLSPSIVSNAATAIGRLTLNCTSLVAPHLNAIFSNLMDVLVDIEPTLEKDTAIQGICMAIAMNPGCLTDQQLEMFLKMIAAYFTPSSTLQQLAKNVISGYQQTRPSFNQLVSSLPAAFQQQLVLYGL